MLSYFKYQLVFDEKEEAVELENRSSDKPQAEISEERMQIIKDILREEEMIILEEENDDEEDNETDDEEIH